MWRRRSFQALERAGRGFSAVIAACIIGCAEGDHDGADASEQDADIDADIEAAQAQYVNLYTNYRAQDRNFNLDTVVRIDDDGGTWGFYWAMNGQFENGDGWYIGVQQNPSHGKQAIFSVWNARDADCGEHGYRVDFDNEGSGSSCRRTLAWKEGTRYRLRVWQLDPGWWGGWLINEESGAEYFLGKLRAPSGAGALGPDVTDFTEYWGEAVPCDELPHVAAKWFGVSSDNRSHLATRTGEAVGAGCKSVNSASDVGSVSSYHVMGE